MLGAGSAIAPPDETARLRASPGASWGAILAGAVVAVSLSLILLTLGTGLGFASLSPWGDRGLTAHEFTVTSTIWLIVTQWLSAAVGGYITGRLRHRWLATHAHEVFFRDTAHGLVTWGVATLFVVSVLASSVGSLVTVGGRALGGLANVGASGAAAAGVGGAPGSSGPAGGYDIDKLFRSDAGAANDVVASGLPAGQGVRAADAREQAMHIAANAALTGEVSEDDRTYLANLVASRTGASAGETQKRVDAFIQSIKDARVKAQAAADEARKAASATALYTALALLIGAFIASVSAALGGRLRDEHL